MNKLLRKKIVIAKKVSRILQIVPFIRLIGLCNSVAAGNAKKDSDIDLFIISRKKYIFTVRYFCVFLITLFGYKSYPGKKKTKNRISLSFFLSDDSLNLDRINKNKKEKDLRREWILNMFPLFDYKNTYLDFVDKNSWASVGYPRYYANMAKKTVNISYSSLFYIMRKISELVGHTFIGRIFENFYKNIQLKRLSNLKHKYSGREKIIVNDKIIKLHFCDTKNESFLY